MAKIKILFERWWIVLVLIVLTPFFYNTALANERSTNYTNNGFFTFWLSGQMNWTGGHPYSAEWVEGHHVNGAIWIPNKIFPYPLPLALLMAPLGLLPIKEAYILWGLLSQWIVAAIILLLATMWQGLNRRLFAIFIVVAFILNSNIKLMLLTGTIGSLFLIFLAAGLYLKRKNYDFAAGMALALLALKPPLLTIVILIGIWMLIQRNWKMIGGVIAGGLGLFVIGMIQDVNWVSKFRGASENLFSMRLGNQPTIISYTRLACGGEMTCATVFYIMAVLLLIGLYALLIWKKRGTLTPVTVFSAAIALGVLLPPYIWSYDYVLLVIPLCYICMDSIRRTSSYVLATLFLMVLDGLSFGMAYLFWQHPESSAVTIQRDMWSIWVGLLLLITTWWMVFKLKPEEPTPPLDNSLSAAANASPNKF